MVSVYNVLAITTIETIDAQRINVAVYVNVTLMLEFENLEGVHKLNSEPFLLVNEKKILCQKDHLYIVYSNLFLNE